MRIDRSKAKGGLSNGANQAARHDSAVVNTYCLIHAHYELGIEATFWGHQGNLDMASAQLEKREEKASCLRMAIT